MKELIIEYWNKLRTWLQREAGIKDARLLLGLVIGMAVIGLMTTLSARISELHRLEAHREDLIVEVEDLVETRDAMKTQVVYASSDAAAADWARGEGHMMQEGDSVVVPIPDMNVTPQVETTPVPTQHVPEPAEVWQALFFGD